MKYPKFECDLHLHSNRSDGNDSVKELIDTASNIGMKVIALTDHDVCPPDYIDEGRKINVFEYSVSRGIRFIPGIEFSCDTYVDDVHIIGLGCNFKSSSIIDIESLMKKSKKDGYKKLVRILNEDGMDITWDDVTNGDEENIQRKHIFEMIAIKGYTKTWKEAKVLVRDNPRYNVRREKVDPVYAIKSIRESGGVSILAHPYLIDDIVLVEGRIKTSRRDYINSLIENGLQGIEAAYTYDKTSYKGNLKREEIEKIIRNEYENQLPIISGGSDYHADQKKGVKNPRRIGEAGVTYDYLINNKLLNKI